MHGQRPQRRTVLQAAVEFFLGGRNPEALDSANVDFGKNLTGEDAKAVLLAELEAEHGEEEPTHAVLVHIVLSDNDVGTHDERQEIFALGRALEVAVEEANLGEYDGEEFTDGRCILFMYGLDANELYATIEPTLRASPLVRGGWVVRRYGSDLAAKEIRTSL